MLVSIQLVILTFFLQLFSTFNLPTFPQNPLTNLQEIGRLSKSKTSRRKNKNALRNEKAKKQKSESDIERWNKYVNELNDRNAPDHFEETVRICVRIQILISEDTDDGGGDVKLKLGDYCLGGYHENYMHQGKNIVSLNRLRRSEPHFYPDNLSIIPWWRNVVAEWCLDESEEKKFEWMQQHYDAP
jgi:hypothetical protein